MTVKDLRRGKQWVQGPDSTGAMTLEVVRRDTEISATWMRPRSSHPAGNVAAGAESGGADPDPHG